MANFLSYPVRPSFHLPHWTIYHDSYSYGVGFNLNVHLLTLSACLHACQHTAKLPCTSVLYRSWFRNCVMYDKNTRDGRLIARSSYTNFDYYEMTTGKKNHAAEILVPYFFIPVIPITTTVDYLNADQ